MCETIRAESLRLFSILTIGASGNWGSDRRSCLHCFSGRDSRWVEASGRLQKHVSSPTDRYVVQSTGLICHRAPSVVPISVAGEARHQTTGFGTRLSAPSKCVIYPSVGTVGPRSTRFGPKIPHQPNGFVTTVSFLPRRASQPFQTYLGLCALSVRTDQVVATPPAGPSTCTPSGGPRRRRSSSGRGESSAALWP